MYKLCSQKAIRSGKRKAATLYFLFFIVLCGGLVVSQSQLYARLSAVTVQSEGIGTTQSEASTDALIQAISKVNGAEVASQMTSSIKESFSNTNHREDYVLTEDFQRNIATRTKGVVKSWKILDAFQSPELNNLWVVRLEVDVSKYEASKQLKRLRMSILQFRIGEDATQIEKSTLFQKTFTRQLENYLTQSRRFAMLDREFLTEQAQELSFIANEGVNIEELARFGNRVGTDYIIVGEIENADVTSTKRIMKSTQKTFVVTKSSGRVSYRIIDVASTQIKFSDTIETFVSGDGLTTAAKKLAYTAGETILNAIYPIKVVAGTSNQLTLGQGGITVKTGQKYNIVKLGRRIVDPYTKEIIGREEIIVGQVRIVDVQAKSSTAEVVSGYEDLLPSIKNMTLIIRPMKDVQKTDTSNNKSMTKKSKEVIRKGQDSINKLENTLEEEW